MSIVLSSGSKSAGVSSKKYPIVKRKKKSSKAPFRSRGPSRSLPNSALLRQRYCTSAITLTCTSGAWAYWQFAINNAYDPDYTGIGHQPMLFDQMTTLYKDYRVVGFKISAYASNNTTERPFVLTMLGTATVSGASSEEQLIEIPNLQKRVKFGGSNYQVLSASSKVKPWKVLGVKKSAYMSDDQYKGVTTGAPAVIPYMTVYAQPFDQVTSTTIFLYAVIEMDVLYSSPKIVAQS